MTPEEASGLIEEAISKALPSLEDHDENDVLTDWVVVAYAANPDKEKGGSYPMFFSSGTLPDYRARGLLNMAMFYNGMNLLAEGPD